jgi:putative PIN family toxin of toxin-antitoxin system
MEMALGGEVALFISDDILGETVRVLRKKFGFWDQRLARAEGHIIACTERVKTETRIDVIKEDPDDNRVLECAVAAGSELIVTGDFDLLRFGTYEGIRIITVRAFLDQGTK